jgi:putative sigma-54 modulation protein
MEPSDALRDYAHDKLSRIEKYLDSVLEANVVLSVEKFRHTADITILSDGHKINGQEQTEDMYSAIDMVVDKIERQIKRHRQKTRNRKGNKKRETIKESGFEPAPAETLEEDQPPRIFTTTQVFAKPMDVDEAIMQLDLTGEDFLVFTNSITKKVNVIHKRKDGNYELIETVTE